MGKWSETIKAFWMGAMSSEYVAWKGSHQIYIFDCNEYPKPPSDIISFSRRIETVEDFNEALESGTRMSANYTEVGTGAFGD